ncbi:MAG: short-chain dehydrogenase [Pseudomonadales bacterium]|jgi:NAD(P)-dependent dehydrogenase (short-subunit alcohol dehydrogenase family)|nr:short-chain dehydrogenase [Pseudomonadales bacterium]MEC8811721.1 SDR family oxidoreductase [Pseudomonadota bacterium]HAG94699.1 short-chain dehydrogenase [Gammaproteobacteria bacterium]MAQ26973.1 short-chain dehydrogenase [Pseudomonadales bacterium]HAU13833.1 short-chain dehydrogenase [Gammaproteobacteria bacterium]|tara:strand:- start:824 stop:1558 length:735 start_codon:yes stop_codon:yes gene_type:complete
MSLSIKNKVALVTGANRGIGKAIVESFLAHGADKVYLAVRNPETTTDLARTYGERVVTLPVDMSNAESIASLAQHARDVQVVVNNAGVLEIADPLCDHVEAALEAEITVNVLGLIRVAKAFAPILEANGGGALVQLNSVASITNFTEFTTYSASKAAAYSVTQGLRDKLAPKGIQVLSVHPGPIATDMAAKAGLTGDPASSVAEGVVAALEQGAFHLFPDTVAQEIWGAYQGFAQAIITPPPAQ